MKNPSFRLVLLTTCLLAPIAAMAEEESQITYSPKEVIIIVTGIANENYSGQDIVDNEFKKCMNENGDTVGMNRCYGRAYKQYEVVLQQMYQGMKNSMPAETRAELVASQQKWEAYRQSYRDFRSWSKGQNRGTIFSIHLWSVSLSQIKQRLKELALYADLLPV